jgi:23S rRNA (adenine2503-C2)-methyltransferase
VLQNAGVTANLRLEKGHDIDAACGQLRLKQETEEGIITAVPGNAMPLTRQK